MLALADLGVRELTVFARRPERAAALAQLASTLGLTTDVRSLGEGADRVDLVASTIPAAAAAPHADALATAADVVFDVVYDPWPTPLTAAAQRKGRMVLNGLDLLAGQAVDQFHLLTGHRVTYQQCRSAAGRELKARSAL